MKLHLWLLLALALPAFSEVTTSPIVPAVGNTVVEDQYVTIKGSQ